MPETKIIGKLSTWLKYILTILLGTGVVFASTTPVFASSISFGTPVEMRSLTISAGTTVSYSDDTFYYVKVPIYLNIQFNNATMGQFVSGTCVLSSSFKNSFTFKDSNGSALAIDSVDPTGNEGITINRWWDQYPVLTIDNMIYSGGNMFAGNLVFRFVRSNTGQQNVIPNNSTVTITTGTTYMWLSDSPFGFCESMISAIENSSSVEQMLDILDTISSDSGYLPEIFNELQTRLPQLYSLIQQVWNTDQAILSVNQSTYTTVLSILAILQNAYAPQESKAEQIVDDVEQGLGQLEMDLTVTMPSGVADISDDYIAQIDTTYNNSVFNILFNPTLVLMLCICFALAILSYMLYGGK